MAFDIPRGRILPVEDVDVRLLAGPHPFEDGNAAAIRENWQREKAAKPALFDGSVMLLADLAYRDARLVGHCHVVGYSTFLLWRSRRPLASAEHAFAHAALVSSDGALVAIRMAPHTVNAGQVYFAAGSFEPEDCHDGRIGLDVNMAREVREETGLDIADLPRDPRFQIYSDVAGTAIFRRFYLAETADRAARRIAAFAAAEPDPEISEPVVIRSAEDLPEGLMPHMHAMVRWHFAGTSQRSAAGTSL